MPVPIFGDSKTTIVEQSEDQKAQREIQKKQLQAALTEQKQNDARRAVSRTRSVGESSRKSDTDRITLKAHSRSEFKKGTSRHEHLSFKAHSGHDLGMSSQEASTESKRCYGCRSSCVEYFKKKCSIDSTGQTPVSISFALKSILKHAGPSYTKKRANASSFAS